MQPHVSPVASALGCQEHVAERNARQGEDAIARYVRLVQCGRFRVVQAAGVW